MLQHLGRRDERSLLQTEDSTSSATTGASGVLVLHQRTSCLYDKGGLPI